MCTIRTSFFSSKWGGTRISNYFSILWIYTRKKNVFQQFLYIFKKSFELMIHGLWNRFNFPFLVHVDIWLTTYVPHVDKRGHFIDHISALSCPRNFWTTPWPTLHLKISCIFNGCTWGIKTCWFQQLWKERRHFHRNF